MATKINVNQIERIDPPGDEFFFRHYIRRNKPVVVTGGIRKWGAVSSWTFGYLKSKIGSKQVQVETRQAKTSPLAVRVKKMTVRNYINREILSKNSKQVAYMAQISIPDAFPSLLEDIIYPPYFGMKSHITTSLWFGPAGTISPLHFDDFDNWFGQVAGRKRFVVFAPDEARRLYPFPISGSKYAHHCQVDISDPDLVKFPRFAEATAFECTLGPGDALFLPVFWWHQVASLDTNISVSTWWRPNWFRNLHRWQFRRTVWSHLRYRKYGMLMFTLMGR